MNTFVASFDTTVRQMTEMSQQKLSPHPEVFGSVSRLPWSTEICCVICTIRLPHILGLWNWNPNFSLQLHHLKVFGPGSSHPKSQLRHFSWTYMD